MRIRFSPSAFLLLALSSICLLSVTVLAESAMAGTVILDLLGDDSGESDEEFEESEEPAFRFKTETKESVVDDMNVYDSLKAQPNDTPLIAPNQP